MNNYEYYLRNDYPISDCRVVVCCYFKKNILPIVSREYGRNVIEKLGLLDTACKVKFTHYAALTVEQSDIVG